jgi:hypothetical protein
METNMKRFKDFMGKKIEEYMENINFDLDEIKSESDIVEQIDCDLLSEYLIQSIRERVIEYHPDSRLGESICGKCYRIYGKWVSDSGHSLDEPEISKKGTRIIIMNDF